MEKTCFICRVQESFTKNSTLNLFFFCVKHLFRSWTIIINSTLKIKKKNNKNNNVINFCMSILLLVLAYFFFFFFFYVMRFTSLSALARVSLCIVHIKLIHAQCIRIHIWQTVRYTVNAHKLIYFSQCLVAFSVSLWWVVDRSTENRKEVARFELWKKN